MGRGKVSSYQKWFLAAIDQASLFSAKGVSVILMTMMVLTCADVALRHFFSWSIVGTIEIESNYFMAAVVFLPLAYGMTSRQGHIRVDIFTSRLPLRVQMGLEVFVLFLSLGVFGLMTWYGLVGGWHSWRTAETMVNVGFPVWPGRALVAVGGALLFLQIIVRIGRLVRVLFNA